MMPLPAVWIFQLLRARPGDQLVDLYPARTLITALSTTVAALIFGFAAEGVLSALTNDARSGADRGGLATLRGHARRRRAVLRRPTGARRADCRRGRDRGRLR